MGLPMISSTHLAICSVPNTYPKTSLQQQADLMLILINLTKDITLIFKSVILTEGPNNSTSKFPSNQLVVLNTGAHNTVLLSSLETLNNLVHPNSLVNSHLVPHNHLLLLNHLDHHSTLTLMFHHSNSPIITKVLVSSETRIQT
jgi:hypothetical protein